MKQNRAQELDGNLENNNRSHSKRMIIAMIVTIMAFAINCIINLVITPVITNTIGAEAYGYVTLAKNFTSYADVLMIALNAYAARFITLAYLRGDDKSFNTYYSTVFIADAVMGLAIFIVGLICVLNLQNLLNISSTLVNDVKALFLLTFVGFFFTTTSTAFSAIGYVKDRIDILNSIKILSYLMEILIIAFCFIILTPKVWYMGLATAGMAVTTFIGTFGMSRKLIPEAKVLPKKFSMKAVKELVYSGIWNSANSLGNTLNSGLDLLISNLMLSGTVMGQVSIAKTISNVVLSFYSVVSQPFQPTFLQDYSDKNTDRLIGHFKDSMRFSGIITNVIFAGFCAVGLSFYHLWIPTQDINLIYVLTIIAMVPSITEGCVYPLYYTYTLTLKNKFPCVVTILGGVANITSMYFLLRYTNTGAYAVLLTTAVIMTFINIVTNPIYMSLCLGVPKRTFYQIIVRNIVACLIDTLVLCLISNRLTLYVGWGRLILRMIVMAFIGLVVQIPIIFNKAEFKAMMQMIKSKLHK